MTPTGTYIQIPKESPKQVLQMSNTWDYTESLYSTATDLVGIRQSNNYMFLLDKFNQEIREYDYELNIDKNLISDEFHNISNFLVSLNPDKISVELTYENSLIFTLILGRLVIFFEKYFDNPDEEVIYSIYLDKKLVKNTSLSLKNSFLNLKQDLILI